MAEIAAFIGQIASEYIREIGQLNGKNALFGSIVFGYCHSTQRLRGFEIKPRLDQSFLVCDVVEHDLSQINSIIVIGSCPDLLRQRIDSDRDAAIARGDVNPVLDLDRPTRALQALINENADPTVGGMIQQGWATAAGFEITAKASPITPRQPSARNMGLFVLGFDVLEMQQIG